MKINLLLISFFSLSICNNLSAQCVGTIPSNAVVVNTTTTINGGFDPIWVCTPDTLISDGGFHNIFLEVGSVMTTGGGIDTIYVKHGAKFYMQGGIHVVYYLNPQDVFFGGGIPTKILCDSLKFDTKNAPVNGCIATQVIDAGSLSAWPVIVANPVHDFLSFSFAANSNEKYDLSIYNQLGELLFHSSISESKNIINSPLEKGIYYYQLTNSTLLSTTGKFVVE